MNNSIQVIPPEDDSVAKKIAYVIYILNLLSLFMPILPIIGVIFAYIFEDDATGYLKSHYQYLIRSFWLIILYLTIAGLSVLVLIGFVLIPLCLIWWVIRMVKGLKSLMRDQPLARPKTFGV